jgi:hypothetical protein
MIKILAVAILVGSTLIGSAAMNQTSHLGVAAELPGRSLKWIHIAERVFAREGLKVDDGTIIVDEQEDSVTVMLTELNPSKKIRGSGDPGYEVEISKKTKKVVRANYIR